MTLRTAVLVNIVIAIIIVACGGGGEEQEPTATMPPGETATDTPITDSPTQPLEEDTPAAAPAAANFSLCLLDAEDADQALGEFVTGLPGGNLNCTYQTESGSYLRIELGSPDDLQPGAELAGVGGEPVPGVGDEAVWFEGVEVQSHHFDFDDRVTLGVLSLRQGDVYLRIMLHLPDRDDLAQQEVVTGAAAIAISQLP